MQTGSRSGRWRQKSGEGVFEVGEFVAANAFVGAVDAEDARSDAEWAEATAQGGFGERFVILDFEPGGVGQVAQGLEEVAGRQTLDAKAGEDAADVGEQMDVG